MKKIYPLLIPFILLPFALNAQSGNVGIGTTTPVENLHIKTTGVGINSTILIDSEAASQILMEGPAGQSKSLLFQESTNRVGGLIWVNDLLKIYSDYSGIIPAPTLTLASDYRVGINMGTLGVPEQKLTVNGKMKIGDDGITPSAGTLKFNAGTNAFQGYNGSVWSNLESKWAINNKDLYYIDGSVGIGVITPDAKLHLAGGNGSISESEGDLKIGSPSHRLVMGVNTSGDFAGEARIYSKGGSKKLILGAESSDIMTIVSDGLVGIGTTNPSYPLELVTSQQTGSRFTNSYSGSSFKYGLRVESTSAGTGTKYGIRGDATANSIQNDTKHIYGVYGLANGNSSDANTYGVYGLAALSGDGNKYGVYAEAGLSDPAQGKKSFAFYANGHSYFQNDVRIGSLEPVTGYKLVVDGKMISEELKVQLSDVWPDYVFDEDYPLMPLDKLSVFLQNQRHLPGVPSADEVNEENGIHVGEMNRILLEKIEELTLYILKQQEEIDVLKQSMEEILNNPSKF